MIEGAGFKDHFSGLAAGYSSFRPRYPDSLFEALAALAPARDLAWDCGCGSGQASLGLAEVFRRIEATDASARQIAEATPHERIRYRVAPAEASGLESGSADLVLVAQAAHWFDLPAFYAEARRVAKPKGLLALVSYAVFEIDEALDPVLQRFHDETMSPWWPEERSHVVTGYRDLPFPFRELPPPEVAMTVDWDLAQLLGYLGTWSSVGRCRRETGEDPLGPLAAELAPLWGPAAGRRSIRWPFKLRLARLADYQG